MADREEVLEEVPPMASAIRLLHPRPSYDRDVDERQHRNILDVEVDLVDDARVVCDVRDTLTRIAWATAEQRM